MLKEDFIQFQSFYGSTICNSLLTHEMKSDSLVVLFPGKNYTCQNPLLYYAHMTALTKGCDILSLEYGFSTSEKKFLLNDFQAVVKEILLTLNRCDLSSYKNIYFISKSLGTMFAGEVSTQLNTLPIKNLFLTPLDKTIPYMKKDGTVVVAGSKDELFPTTCISITKNIPSCRLILVEEGDHSLETLCDVAKNLEILKEITHLFKEFIT